MVDAAEAGGKVEPKSSATDRIRQYTGTTGQYTGTTDQYTGTTGSATDRIRQRKSVDHEVERQ